MKKRMKLASMCVAMSLLISCFSGVSAVSAADGEADMIVTAAEESFEEEAAEDEIYEEETAEEEEAVIAEDENSDGEADTEEDISEEVQADADEETADAEENGNIELSAFETLVDGTVLWQPEKAEDNSVKISEGVELMPGLVAAEDMTGGGSSKTYGDGTKLTYYVAGSTNAALTETGATGAALLYTAPSDGKLTVYLQKLDNNKEFAIVEAGITDKTKGIFYEKNETGANIDPYMASVTVKAGKKYVLAGFGTKVRFMGVAFKASEGGGSEETPEITTGGSEETPEITTGGSEETPEVTTGGSEETPEITTSGSQEVPDEAGWNDADSWKADGTDVAKDATFMGGKLTVLWDMQTGVPNFDDTKPEGEKGDGFAEVNGVKFEHFVRSTTGGSKGDGQNGTWKVVQGQDSSGFKFVPTEDGILTAYVTNLGNTKYFAIYDKNTTAKDTFVIGTNGESGDCGIYAPVKAGETYWITVDGSKGAFLGVSFTATDKTDKGVIGGSKAEEKPPVVVEDEPGWWRADSKKAAITNGDKFMDGALTATDNMTYASQNNTIGEVKFTGYVTGTADGNVDGTGSGFTFVPAKNGKLTVYFTGFGGDADPAKAKTFVIVEKGKTKDEAAATHTSEAGVKSSTSISANVTAGTEYVIAGLGTKARYVAVHFEEDGGGDNPNPPTPPTVADNEYGDIDGTEGVTPNDAAMIMSYVLNPTTVTLPEGINKDVFMARADVDGNGVVTAADAASVLKKAMLQENFNFKVVADKNKE